MGECAERNSKVKDESLDRKGVERSEVRRRTFVGKHICSNGVTRLICLYYRNTVFSFALDFALEYIIS